MRIYVFIAFSIAAIITMLLRVSPFLFFKGREVPEHISYLGEVLPLSIYIILIIYNLRSTNFSSAPFGIAEILGVLVGGLVQYLSKNTILSLLLSTIIYMTLLRVM